MLVVHDVRVERNTHRNDDAGDTRERQCQAVVRTKPRNDRPKQRAFNTQLHDRKETKDPVEGHHVGGHEQDSDKTSNQTGMQRVASESRGNNLRLLLFELHWQGAVLQRGRKILRRPFRKRSRDLDLVGLETLAVDAWSRKHTTVEHDGQLTRGAGRTLREALTSNGVESTNTVSTTLEDRSDDPLA
ncbi:unannotated protein [freshwater metagenome]|uniref:Unannotated protein n=1 Tax=freshwater metagenome TaxID=449393 RepID=A0A6J6P4X0_9ZZZZ